MLKKEGVKIGSFFVIKISFSGITTFSAKISVYKLKESGSCINIYLAILGVFFVYHL